MDVLDEDGCCGAPPPGPPPPGGVGGGGDMKDKEGSCSSGGEEESDPDVMEEDDDDVDDVASSRGSMEDEFLKQAEVETGEHLSDQTPGGLCLYDCSLSTPTDKSFSNFSHTFNDRHIHDLSCSMLADGSQCFSKFSYEDLVHNLRSELGKKDKLIKALYTTIEAASEEQEGSVNKTKKLISEVSVIKENFDDLTNLSQWSFDEKREENAPNSGESFRLSSYMRKLPFQGETGESQSQPQDLDNKVVSAPADRSIQTSPAVPCSNQLKQPCFDNEAVKSLCLSVLSVTSGFKDELETVRGLVKRPFEDSEYFPMKKIMMGMQEITKCHEAEMLDANNQLAAERKHHQEVVSSMNDEVKTLKMRLQQKAKQRDNDVAVIAELKARLLEATGSELPLNENLNTVGIDPSHPPLDESFNSNSEEETFSNLSRMKVEYLKLTPSEYVDDEIIDTVHIPDSYRQILEDYKLKVFDLEKKLDASRRYLDEQTHDREMERDEFQHALESLQNQMEELKKENGKLYEINKQNIYQMEEYDARLKRAEEDEMDMIQKHEKSEVDLKAAIEKIVELREIIRDLEKQVDALSTSAIQLKEQNQVLLDELEKQEILSKREPPVLKEQDNCGTLPVDITEEIHAQLYDLAKKIELKISEMDNFPLHTRPNSSCSGVASAVSTEDISCRELAGRSSRNFENFPSEDIGAALLNEIRRLDSQFESLGRFEDVLMKKVKDSDLRCSGQKAKIEELEGQVSIYQENCSCQMLKIADLEGKIDALRFESSNQDVIQSLKSRLGNASKQLEEFKVLLASKEQELSQIKIELNTLKIQQVETIVETKEMSSQTSSGLDTTSFTGFTYEGVSPEKIRRMDSVNPLSTSLMSISNNVHNDGHAMSIEPDFERKGYDTMNRTGLSTGSSRGDGDNFDNSERGSSTIKELDENLLELQKLLTQKDKMIRSLKEELSKIDSQAEKAKGDHGLKPSLAMALKDKCEEENVTIDMNLSGRGDHTQKAKGQASDGKECVYETTYASEYEVKGDLLKYIGTKLLSDGVRKENPAAHSKCQVRETELEVEVATLNTVILQWKEAFEGERKRSESLHKQLKSCEQGKADLRGQIASAPVQRVVSSQSISDLQIQQRELVHQVEEGRASLSIKNNEIIHLKDHITNLETRLNAKVEYEQELLTRLNSTSSSLRRCEEHGRELSAKNLENIKEIRRLRDQLDKLHASSRNSENFPVVLSGQTGGSEYLEHFMRAKSHKKALAWQKKYLTTVILGYKSILRQVGQGNEHPELLQIPIPLAPSAVGLLDKRSHKRDFRVVGLVVLATIRMKYMVNRWHKKRTAEGSPDSEYNMSRQQSRIDQNIRPAKGILMQNKNNPTVLPFSTSSAPAAPVVNNNSFIPHNSRGNVDQISEYLSRFESIENEISSSLSRNPFPS